MNEISEQLLQAIDVLTDEKISKLEYDKTILAKITKIINLDEGEYKVRYSGNIFSAFANDLNAAYKVDDLVYVTIPEGNFSAKKLITSLVSTNSLSYNQLAALLNTIFEISPEFDALYGGNLYQKNEEFGVIAGTAVGAPSSYNYIYNGPSKFLASGFHGLFLQYANNYELIRILADFQTRFYDVHEKGNYGLVVEFYAKGDDVVSYRLDLNAFNGDPYRLNTYTPQSVIIKVQKNYLLGLKSIKLFEEDFAYDRIVENGLVTNKENTTEPNIFAKNISLQYVDVKDLTDTNYYLMISAPLGIAFTSNVSTLELHGRLVYQGKDIMDEETCKCKWFARDLTVMIGDASYDKEAGFGWRPLPQTSSLLSLVASDVRYEQRYKLLVTYNGTVSLSAEIEIFNHNARYSYLIEQHTNGDDISLLLVNNLENGELVGDWFLSYPDGKYVELSNGKKKNSVSVSQYLKYSSVTFYCLIYDLSKTNIIGTLEHTIVNSESDEDVTIAYTGEDSFRYDANGDITIEDSEKERTLLVVLTWKEGFGTAYTVLWLMRDLTGKEIPLTGNESRPELSMIDNLWVDNYNILHYNIKLKYKVNFNNNTLVVKIKTITEQEYKFDKEILFLKDGDLGTNGTTYIIAVRPCDSRGLKLSGLQPLIYNGGWQNTLPLRCYVYKDGEFINNNSKYDITYKWTGTNITFSETAPTDRVTARGSGYISSSSPSQNLQFYVKVLVDINDKMNGRKNTIYASYPIDVAVGGINTSLIDISNIPSYIKYTASGITPLFYSNNIQFLYNKKDKTESIYSMNRLILDIETKDGLKYLKPATSFIAENVKDLSLSNIGVLKCQYTTSQFLIHPIIMYLDTYGNEAINGWDGESIKWNDEGTDRYIFAPLIGAGEKDSYNRFSGVVMGKDSTQDKTGLYGYQYGLNTFGLMEDGIAYFGAKSGGGQIVINGKEAHIYGGGLYPAGSGLAAVGGDAPNGMSIYLANLKPSNPGKQYAIKIGAGVFSVMYDGALKATSADITGKIYAQEGQIGCDASHRGGWKITSNRISSGSGSNTVALDSSESSYFRIWAGRSEGGNSYSSTASLDKRISNPAKFVVTKDGFVYMDSCFVKGRIEAEEGKIGGWNILRNRLVSDGKKVGLGSSGIYRFWANADEGGSVDDTPIFTGSTYFYVKSNGEMSCRNATVRGKIYSEEGEIGGWKITSSGLSNGDNIYIRSNGSMKVGDDFLVSSSGRLTANSATILGKITADSGRIGGWRIDDNAIVNGSTRLNADGSIRCDSLTAYNATISGDITANTLTANDGEIGGWTITKNGLSGSNIFLDPTGGIYLSQGNRNAGLDFGSDGIYLRTTSGPITISSGSISGVYLNANGGKITLDCGSIECTADASMLRGFYARYA